MSSSSKWTGGGQRWRSEIRSPLDRVLSEALSLWRGPVLADLVEDGMAWPELTAIQERRLDVMEDRFEAELASGGHHAILRELEAFVQDEPLRERAAQQLMLALYRCGRQADALGVYRRVRTALVDGLGLEPGREMQLLRQSILTHDPALDLLAEVTAQRETATVTGGSGTMVIGGEDPPTATWERAAAAPPDVPELTLAVAAEDSPAGRGLPVSCCCASRSERSSSRRCPLTTSTGCWRRCPRWPARRSSDTAAWPRPPSAPSS
ncbi:AfsR/SARP family transcriptional regulator [Streptomyces indonesiensis]